MGAFVWARYTFIVNTTEQDLPFGPGQAQPRRGCVHLIPLTLLPPPLYSRANSNPENQDEIDMLTDDERSKLLDGLKANWAQVNSVPPSPD